MYQGIETINRSFPPPNVHTQGFYGVDVKTPLSFHYTRSFPKGTEDNPEVTMGEQSIFKGHRSIFVGLTIMEVIPSGVGYSVISIT